MTDDQGAIGSANATKVVLNRPNIAIKDVAPSKNVVGQGFTMDINVTVTNQGDFTETFHVTVYANTTTIETKEVILESGASTTLTFTWNTTGFAKGNYTIWAYAWPVPGEIDITCNTLTDGTVYVGIPGDINADGFVNAKDAVKIGAIFGTKQGEEDYDPDADINNDGYINAKDTVVLGKYFGQQDP